jgi:hypothetical protein
LKNTVAVFGLCSNAILGSFRLLIFSGLLLRHRLFKVLVSANQLFLLLISPAKSSLY